MLQRVILCYRMQRSIMDTALESLNLDGTEYYTTVSVMKEVGISRQTLWRWRQKGHIPRGHRFRDGRLLFTSMELERIKEFANNIEAGDTNGTEQGSLF